MSDSVEIRMFIFTTTRVLHPSLLYSILCNPCEKTVMYSRSPTSPGGGAINKVFIYKYTVYLHLIFGLPFNKLKIQNIERTQKEDIDVC